MKAMTTSEHNDSLTIDVGLQADGATRGVINVDVLKRFCISASASASASGAVVAEAVAVGSRIPGGGTRGSTPLRSPSAILFITLIVAAPLVIWDRMRDMFRNSLAMFELGSVASARGALLAG